MERARSTDRGLPSALSTHLDLLRVGAALWVMLSHFRSSQLAADSYSWLLPIRGHDAVIIFFVLSGFVIANTQARKGSTMAGYATDRATRIYSVVIPILLGCWMVEAIGAVWAPALFADPYELRKPWIYLPLHLLFLGEAWSLREVPNLIVPVLVAQFRGLVLRAVRGPRLLSRHQARAARPRDPGAARTAARAHVAGMARRRRSLVGSRALEVAGGDGTRAVRNHPARLRGVRVRRNGPASDRDLDRLYTDAVGHAPGNGRHFLSDYVVAVLVAVNILAFRWSGWRFPRAPARAIAWAAGYSFTLYLLHAPLIIVAKRMIGSDVPDLGISLALLGALLVATVVVGELTEKRREAFRRPVAWLIARAAGLVAARPGLSRLIAPAG
jgi:peptidoglycan/LPS O-acetylase OafA/YrhL